ncbi:MAG: carboxymuconolactone decarboxylase [Burkholderiales bacterium 66-5]|uniref:carboxymuconolactone decarboxylase family protein n=1 Tax=Comamonas badia TaxID=265291 RepID=UPI0003FC75D9|nr:carboxymuconolactone decarboxylase family protein [Comamonas badia]OJU91864.1 MAG: carboxymuconolactone decarboxylase [Burkholderiales bacterium 66-5]
MHEQRLSYRDASPEAFKALLHTEMQVHKTGIEESLLELVKMRASQINGCGYCLDMHSKDAVAQGETLQRLVLLSAWREAPSFYTERERAALAWTEAITQIATHGVPDDLYNEVRKHFDEKALVDLTLAVISINSWNRMAIAFRAKVGDYVSPHGKP